MGDENKDDVIRIPMTEENIINLCECMPDWKEKVWDELPESLQDKLNGATKQPLAKTDNGDSTRGEKTKSLLEYIGKGKTTRELRSAGQSLKLLHNCVTRGYVFQPRRGFYVVSDTGYVRLNDYKQKMSKNDAINMILKFLREHNMSHSSCPEIAHGTLLGVDRCKRCLYDIKDNIDAGILLNYRYKKIAYGGVKSFYIYWYEG